MRWAAEAALGELGEHAAPHLVARAARLRDENVRVREAVMRVLGKLKRSAVPCDSTQVLLAENVGQAPAAEATSQSANHDAALCSSTSWPSSW